MPHHSIDLWNSASGSSLLESELHSTLHDRERREERQIDKEDQLRARRYGMCEHSRKGRLKYTYSGKVLIWDPTRNKAITSWSLSAKEHGGWYSGTSHVDPVLIQKSVPHDSDYAASAHTLVTHQIRNQKDRWVSHTVLVVDMSGSMRTDDVDGARCRSDGVWTCLARDFIQTQVAEGKSSLHDLVSVVLMRDTAEVVLECEPTDFVLYNKLVDLREWTHHRPGGHGNYEPALVAAENLLNINRSGSCALSLFFFSDGKPSDVNKQDIPAKMGALASRFGRRLTVTCVGMANQRTEDFSVLENMVQEAKAYGAIASFNKPSMDADSLSHIISTSLATSLTSTKTELTSVGGKSLRVRDDLIRERRNAPDDLVPTKDWQLFNTDRMYTVNVWTWNHNLKHGAGGFSRLIDPRCASCFGVHVMNTSGEHKGQANKEKGMLCLSCKACFFCWSCINNRKAGQAHTRTQCQERGSLRRQGAMTSLEETVPSFSVARKTKCFGEGAERVAFKFRFLDKDGNFFGPKMVAKESRFVDSKGIESNAARDYLTTQQHSYHVDFMQTQSLASNFAIKYNETLKEWEEHLDHLQNQHVDQSYYRDFNQQRLFHKDRIRKAPRIRFLQPRIFELVDKDEAKTFNVLVEPMIDGAYRKYNNNNGGVVQQRFESPCRQQNNQGLNPSLVKMLLGSKEPERGQVSTSAMNAGRTTANEGTSGLGAIEEEDSDGEGSDVEDNDDGGRGGPTTTATSGQSLFFDSIVQDGDRTDRKLTTAIIPDEDFMQAFSHFSYARSGGRLVVVDLQGTLSVKPDGSREFVLTDPAIHKRRKSRRLKDVKFGRTDRGDKGIRDFFSTHVCNDACRLLGLRPKTRKKGAFSATHMRQRGPTQQTNTSQQP